jgi:nucleolar pre-ribosomal-associated protein 2
MIQKKISKAGEKKKHRLNYALVTIFGAAISAFHARATSLNDLEVIRKEDLDRRTSAFKEGLLAQLKEIFQKFRKGKSRKRKTSQATEHLSIFSIINALSALGADSSKLAELEDDAKAFCASVQGSEVDIGRRLETFMAIHRSNVIGEELLGGDISTVNGRQSIKEKTLASTVGKNKQEKLKLLESIFGPGLVGLTRLDKLLAAQQVIILIEDTRKPTEDEEQQEDSETNIEDGFDLSEAYSILCGNLWKATGVRQFCIISETLELMIRTKVNFSSTHPIQPL